MVTPRYAKHALLLLISTAWCCFITYGEVNSTDKRHAPSEILRASHVDTGLCVIIGLENEGQLVSMVTGGHFLVHALVKDPVFLEKTRRSLAQKNLYGLVTIDLLTPNKLPYADRMVNLIVLHAFPGGTDVELLVQEMARVLRPGGEIIISEQLFAREKVQAHLDAAEVIVAKPGSKGGDRVRIVKRFLEKYNVIGPPTKLKWVAGPRTFGGALKGTRSRVGKGLNFYIHMAPAGRQASGKKGRWISARGYYLTARDAQNGLMAWRNQYSYPVSFEKAMADTLYIKTRKGIVELDARTGKQIKTMKDKREIPFYETDALHIFSRGSHFTAVDKRSGREQWKTRSGKYAFGKKNLYIFTKQNNRTGLMTALNIQSGKTIWTVESLNPRGRAKKSQEKDNGFFEYQDVLVLKLSVPTGHHLKALSIENGKTLWSHRCNRFRLGGDISGEYSGEIAGGGWILSGHESNPDAHTTWGKRVIWGFDPKTGKLARTFEYPDYWSRIRCSGHQSNEVAAIGFNTEFLDFNTGRYFVPNTTRGTCGASFFLGSGLINVYPNRCTCFAMIRGFAGYSTDYRPLEKNPFGNNREAAHPFQKGPAYGKVKHAELSDSEEDWPTYRHDPGRSGSTPARITSFFKVKWEKQFNIPKGALFSEDWRNNPTATPVSAVTSAGGLITFSIIDSHVVIALNGDTGEILWRFMVGGRVDSPPTHYKGVCLFGCNDGWVYCLRARDGALVWKFRAAPEEKNIVAFGQLESSWPVIGSILVDQDIACFAAGRHSKTDGGLYSFGLEPLSGKVIWSNNIDGFDQSKKNNGLIQELRWSMGRGAIVNSLLTSNGEYFNLGVIYDLKTGKQIFPFGGGKGYGKTVRKLGFLTSTTNLLDKRRYYRTGARLNMRSGYSGGHLLSFSEKDVYGVAHSRGKTVVSRGYQGKVWKINSSLVIKDFLVTGDKVILGGHSPSKDETRGEIAVYSKKDGKLLNEFDISSPPVFQGIAVTRGRLFIATEKGSVICLQNQ